MSSVDKYILPSREHEKKLFAVNTFCPGCMYEVEVECLCFDPYGEFGDHDERIILYFLNKILAEREVPRIAFTKLADGECRIVCGEHIVEAAYRAGLSHITGYYVDPLTIDSPPPVSVLPGGKHVGK